MELDASLPPALLDELRPRLDARREELPVWSVENVCPSSKVQAAELASLDREEAKVARAAAEESLKLAAEVGARYLVLRLGEVRRMADDWTRARRQWLRGDFDGERAAQLARKRMLAGTPHLDPARRALDELSRRADDAGVTLAVRTPSRATGFPSAIELGVLLADLRGGPIAPMWDLPATHLLAEFGVPVAETASAWKSAPLVHAADACGPLAGLVPGTGELDLAPLFADVRSDADVVFTPWARLDAHEVEAGTEAVRRLASTKK